MRITNYELGITNVPPSKAERATRPFLRTLVLILVASIVGLFHGFRLAGPTYASCRYEFVVYPSSAQNEIDALDIDFGAPRVHPGGTLCLTNRNGNLPFRSLERASLDEIDDLIFVGSDSVGVYLDENGWNDEN